MLCELREVRLTPEHQNERYSPCYFSVGLVESFRQVADGKRDGEEIEGIPGLHDWSIFPSPAIHSLDQRLAEASLGNTHPSEEGDHEESPVVPVELHDQTERVGELGHGRLQAAEPRRDVLANTHSVVRRLIALVDAERGGLVIISGKTMLNVGFLVIRHVVILSEH